VGGDKMADIRIVIGDESVAVDVGNAEHRGQMINLMRQGYENTTGPYKAHYLLCWSGMGGEEPKEKGLDELLGDMGLAA
jgi:hypothetical protein